MFHSTWAFGFFLLVSLIVASDASIHFYRNKRFKPILNVGVFDGGSEGLYGSSSISFNEVTFVRTVEAASKHNATESTTGLVEAILFDMKYLNRIGGFHLRTTDICCTRVLADAGSCSLGEVIITRFPEDLNGPIRIKTFFQGNQTEATMSPESVRINKTGMYCLYFAICDPQLINGTVTKGRTVWKNPHGYLSGKAVPLMKFFGFMSVAYLALGLVWFIRAVQYWKTLIRLHFHITLIIGLAMYEMSLRYFDTVDFNSTGLKQLSVVIWLVLFSSVKKTLSRLWMLLLSMGYGITNVSVTWSMLVLAVMYFVVTVPLEFNDNLATINDRPRYRLTMLVVQVIIRDAFFILWIVLSLAKSIQNFQASGNIAKLQLYRRFAVALVIFVVVSLGWIGFELHCGTTDPLSALWKMAWIIPAFWHCLSFGFLALMCILWDPSNTLTRPHIPPLNT